MLKVIGSLDVAETELVIDERVPLSFKCPSVWSVPSVWWRTGNLKTSLVEIGIGSEKKAVYDVSVICLPGVEDRYSSFDDLIRTPPPEVEGVPIVDIAGLADEERISHIDEPLELSSYFVGDSLFIWFGDLTVVSTFYRVDRFSLGVNDLNQICCIKADSLSPSEVRLIASSSPT